MPAPVRPSLRLALVLLCLPALAALVVSGLSRPPATDARGALMRMDDWEVNDLIGHLRARGLNFRAVPTWKGGAIVRNAFLVRGERPWEELEGLIKSPARLDRWEGVVFCERLGPEAAEARVLSWGDACLRAGPFLFFGDPEFLMQIRPALSAGEQGSGT